jgi:hypothetical protein
MPACLKIGAGIFKGDPPPFGHHPFIAVTCARPLATFWDKKLLHKLVRRKGLLELSESQNDVILWNSKFLMEGQLCTWQALITSCALANFSCCS